MASSLPPDVIRIMDSPPPSPASPPPRSPPPCPLAAPSGSSGPAAVSTADLPACPPVAPWGSDARWLHLLEGVDGERSGTPPPPTPLTPGANG
eukprot:16037594-Heterocapsa_arctica.AAC.1